MNIVITIEPIEQTCIGSTCFETSNYVRDAINDCKTIKGTVNIDGNTIPFGFSPYFMDGDIFTDNMEYRLIVKHLVPLYVYSNIGQFKKVYNNPKQI